MRYIETHPRKTRGGAIHKTQNEKIHELIFKRMREETMAPASPGKINICMEEREKVEAMYLVPEVEHFVNGPDVKRLSDRIKIWLKAGYPVHLIGPTGCGKTSLAMHTAKELGRPVVWINGDESITTTDLIGGYSQIEQESLRDKYIHNVLKSNDVLKADWIDNPLAIACKYGYTLVYNEFSRTKPTSNNVLLSVFEEGILELPTKFGEERYIKVHPDFRAILTSNSIEYAGVHKPQDALLDRLVSLYMDFYSYETEVNIVLEHTAVSRENAKKIVGIVRAMRERLPESQKPGTRACIMIGDGLKAVNGHQGIKLDQICMDVMAAKTGSSMELQEKQNMVKEILKEIA